MTQPSTIDMLLINLPWADLQVPQCAPAVLKGIAESSGLVIKTRDFNVDFKFKFCNNNQDTFEELQEFFISVDNTQQESINQYYDYIIDQIRKENPRYLGVSVFSVWTHKSTLQLCRRIKEIAPEISVVLGGRGLNVVPHLSIRSELTKLEHLELFSKIMLRKKYTDFVIAGDAEDAIVDFLKGNNNDQYSWNQPKDSKLDYPFSNYDDYQLTKYSGIEGRPQLVVISSKGCVRDCDFCDVAAQFLKFRSKDGVRLAEEMIYLANKYNIYELATADSILNGNIKELRKALVALAEYNKSSQEHKKIKWGGNWICRPAGTIKSEFFKLMADAGCTHLTVGAESGSNRVLEAMNKKTTVEGLYYELEQMSLHGIKCGLNHVVAHWSEQNQDYLDHIDMVLKLGPRYADNTITHMWIGSGFSLLSDTPADRNKNSNGIVSTNDNFSFIWYTKNNPDLTIKVRAARVLTIYKICRYLNIPLLWPYQSLLNLKNRLKETFDSGVDFINQHIGDDFKPCTTIEILNSYQSVVDKWLNNNKPVEVAIDLKANSCNTDPILQIQYGGTTVTRSLTTGNHTVKFDIEPATDNKNLVLSMINKGANDTKVDSDGNIVQDKSIEFSSVKIDGLDILKDLHYWFNVLKHYDGEVELPIGRSGFWANSSVVIPIDRPIWASYLAAKPKLSWSINSSVEKIDQLIDDIEHLINKLPR